MASGTADAWHAYRSVVAGINYRNRLAAADQKLQEDLPKAQEEFAQAAAEAHHDQYLEDTGYWSDYIPGYPGGWYGGWYGPWYGWGSFDGGYNGYWGYYGWWGGSGGYVFGPWYDGGSSLTPGSWLLTPGFAWDCIRTPTRLSGRRTPLQRREGCQRQSSRCDWRVRLAGQSWRRATKPPRPRWRPPPAGDSLRGDDGCG